GEADDAEKKRRMREAVDEDRLTKRLEPGPDAREHVADQVGVEVATAQNRAGLAQKREPAPRRDLDLVGRRHVVEDVLPGGTCSTSQANARSTSAAASGSESTIFT